MNKKPNFFLKVFFRNLFFEFQEIQHKIWRKQLHCHDFTIISNNCWGGTIYQYLNMEYKSPTIGLMIFPEDYVKFCKNIDFYLSQTLKFIPFSSSKQAYRFKNSKCFPVALLYDIEIYFMHYDTQEEANDKWQRRKLRINRSHMIFKMSERDGATEKTIQDFLNLNYKNKILFTQNNYGNKPGAIYIPKLKLVDKIGSSEVGITLQKFNIVKYLNNID